MTDNAASFAADHGLSVNSSNRVYKRGKALSYSEKVQIGHEIQQAEGALLPGQELNYRELGRVCRVSKNTVAKIHNELEEYGRIRSPEEIQASKNVARGPGSVVLSDHAMFVILQLYYHDASTSLAKYAQTVLLATGTRVSTSTISRFFNKGFLFKG